MQVQDIAHIQKEIDQDLWKPFNSAFENLNPENLNSLNADGALRVRPKGIDAENNFRKAHIKRLTAYQKHQTDLGLDFCFDSRQYE